MSETTLGAIRQTIGDGEKIPRCSLSIDEHHPEMAERDILAAAARLIRIIRKYRNDLVGHPGLCEKLRGRIELDVTRSFWATD